MAMAPTVSEPLLLTTDAVAVLLRTPDLASRSRPASPASPPFAGRSARTLEPYQQVAVAFADALVARDFSRARGMLVPALRAALSEHDLEERLTGMYRGYADGDPRRTHFVPEGSLEAWPGKQPGDLGWASVGIEGDDFNEAVYVLVVAMEGVPMFREVEWGRP
jgi:hypothetical protein